MVLSKKENVLVIPKKYLVRQDEKEWVWVQTGTSVRQRKLMEVKTGMTTSTEIEILEGIQEGDTLVAVAEG